jgi:hypothetical protein
VINLFHKLSVNYFKIYIIFYVQKHIYLWNILYIFCSINYKTLQTLVETYSTRYKILVIKLIKTILTIQKTNTINQILYLFIYFKPLYLLN